MTKRRNVNNKANGKQGSEQHKALTIAERLTRTERGEASTHPYLSVTVFFVAMFIERYFNEKQIITDALADVQNSDDSIANQMGNANFFNALFQQAVETDLLSDDARIALHVMF